jgi:hypothetical protein
MVHALEAPDEYISLTRAAELSGRREKTLYDLAMTRRLRTVKMHRQHLTTRRWLHAYLLEARANTKGQFHPLPENYVPPE